MDQIFRATGAILAALLLITPLHAHAQAGFPSRPITIVVPFGAATTADIIARTIGDFLSRDLGQPVVIDNRPGAGGIIGSSIVAHAQPDGYTLVLGTVASHGISTIMFASAPYDPVKDFAPIALIANAPNLLVVNEAVPVSTPAEFIAYAKKSGSLDFTSPGIGTTSQLAGELLRLQLGVPLVHVPYRSGSAALTDVIAGRIPAIIWQVAPVKAQIEAKLLKPIAALSAERISAFPDVPTISETLLPGFDSNAWFGILAPAGTPDDIIETLHHSIVRAMDTNEVKSQFQNQVLEPANLGPKAFGALIASDLKKWRKVVDVTQTKQ